jgi:hypothetical protein
MIVVYGQVPGDGFFDKSSQRAAYIDVLLSGFEYKAKRAVQWRSPRVDLWVKSFDVFDLTIDNPLKDHRLGCIAIRIDVNRASHTGVIFRLSQGITNLARICGIGSADCVK